LGSGLQLADLGELGDATVEPNDQSDDRRLLGGGGGAVALTWAWEIRGDRLRVATAGVGRPGSLRQQGDGDGLNMQPAD